MTATEFRVKVSRIVYPGGTPPDHPLASKESCSAPQYPQKLARPSNICQTQECNSKKRRNRMVTRKFTVPDPVWPTASTRATATTSELLINFGDRRRLVPALQQTAMASQQQATALIESFVTGIQYSCRTRAITRLTEGQCPISPKFTRNFFLPTPVIPV